MSSVTLILDRAPQGDPVAAEELLPLVYDELRRLAAHRSAGRPVRADDEVGPGNLGRTVIRFRTFIVKIVAAMFLIGHIASALGDHRLDWSGDDCVHIRFEWPGQFMRTTS